MTRVRIRGDYSASGAAEADNGVGATQRRKTNDRAILDREKLLRDGVISTGVRSIPNGYKLR